MFRTEGVPALLAAPGVRCYHAKDAAWFGLIEVDISLSSGCHVLERRLLPADVFIFHLLI